MKTFLKQCGIVVLATVVAISGFTTLQIQNRGGINAAEKPECNILYVGDSTTNGYGAKDFSMDDYSFNSKVPISNAYPKKVTNFIKKTGLFSSINPAYVTYNGMRNEEIRALLQKDYFSKISQLEKSIQKEYPACQGYLNDHMNRFFKYYGNGDYDSTHKKFVATVASADIVILDNFMSGAGIYFGNCCVGAMLGNLELAQSTAGYNKITTTNAGVSSENVACAENSVDKVLKKHLGALASLDQLKGLSEIMKFCLADTTDCLNAIVQEIKKINPNAKIMVMGLYDPFDNYYLSIIGQKISLNDIMKDYYAEYNKYLAKNASLYTYVKVQNVQTYAKSWKYVKNSNGNINGNVNNVNALKLTLADEREGFVHLFGDVAKDEKKMLKLILASHDYNTIDGLELLQSSNTLLSGLATKIAEYTAGSKAPTKVFTKNELGVISFISKVLSFSAVGTHPSAKGMNQKTDIVSAAIVKYLTSTHKCKAKNATLIVKKGKKVVAANNINYINGDKVTSVKSSNKKVATVANKTKIKALKKGTSKITVKFRSGLSKSYTVKVK